MKWIIIVLALVPSVTRAQQELTITLDEAVNLALENNKTLRASWERVAAADARRAEVNASRFPSLKLQGGYTRLSEVDPFAVQVPFLATPITISPIVLNTYSAKLSLQQPLFTGFRLDNTYKAASYSADAAQQDYRKEKTELVFSTTSAYWNLFKAIEYKRVVSENVEQMRVHLRDIESFMQRGLATQSEVLKVQVQFSNSRLLEIDADNNVKLAMMSLNNIIGQPLETQLHLSTTPDTLEVSQDGEPLSAIIRKARGNRADLSAMMLRVQANEALLNAARGGGYPQIYLSGNYYYARPNPRIMPTKDEFKDTWDVGVGISFDVWNWMATSHQTAQAEAALAQTRYALEQLNEGITLEVTQNYFEVIKAREKLNVSKQGVEHAEENYRITRSKFAAGVATNTDLLDSEVALLQARTSHVVARVDFELAKARLTKSVGASN